MNNYLLEKHFVLSSQQKEKFELLRKLYVEWNEKINVISRKDILNLDEKHFLHSLSIAKHFAFYANNKILDLGTGGGLPGIPLAILFPEVKFYLVDAIRKKINVVEEICNELNLLNVTPICSRAEELNITDIDIVLSRATAPLQSLITWAKPLLNPKSINKHSGLICLKGGDMETEFADAKVKPKLISLEDTFQLPHYSKKYIVFVEYKKMKQIILMVIILMPQLA